MGQGEHRRFWRPVKPQVLNIIAYMDLGDPNKIDLSGLSAGGHICHQLLHYVGRMAPNMVGLSYLSGLSLNRFLVPLCLGHAALKRLALRSHTSE